MAIAMSSHLACPRGMRVVAMSVQGRCAPATRGDLCPRTFQAASLAGPRLPEMGGRSGFQGASPAGTGRGMLVTCMAHPRRVARVSRQMEREIGQLFIMDKKLRAAISPEEALGVDSAVSAIASVTEVRLSNDLQVAKVYVSVLSDAHGTTVAMSNLIRMTGYVRKKVGEAMRMRLIPEIRFVMDDSIPRGNAVLAVMDRLQQEREGKLKVETPLIVRGGEDGRVGAGSRGKRVTLADLDEMDDDDLESLWDEFEEETNSN
mmetsp:Transcript_67855/g.214666  ORF Transcript_67855/g.214666 Transcript_67855/m.214666 type:complete len:261 (+) Transcript_67855:39-821(+)